VNGELRLKILYVTTISNTVNAFLIPHIKMLKEQGHQVDVAFNIVQEVNVELDRMGCKVHNIEFQRSPLNKHNLSAYSKLKKLIEHEKYDIVHTHTPVASACTRLACKNNKKTKIIYTAHGFHFYKGAPLINWLIYYPVEKWLAKYTDLLLTINQEDYLRATKKFKARKIEYIPGVGLDNRGFAENNVNRSIKRRELDIPENAVVLLSVGELNRNKNHQTIIKAVAQLNNPNIYYLICGQGTLQDYLTGLVNDLGLTRQVRLLGYRKDIPEICKASDLFVFPSYREGLSVALMESMASGIPVVCSNIRGNKDLIEEGKGGFLTKPNDVESFAQAIQTLIQDEELRLNMGEHNRNVIKKFSIDIVNKRLIDIYSNMGRNSGI
jgi:glycosyltransferase involved in cell wall biosynthesis